MNYQNIIYNGVVSAKNKIEATGNFGYPQSTAVSFRILDADLPGTYVNSSNNLTVEIVLEFIDYSICSKMEVIFGIDKFSINAPLPSSDGIEEERFKLFETVLDIFSNSIVIEWYKVFRNS